ncbi:Rv0340 family protein [Mycobacterium sp. OAE908]|uniref:Rv0340 family IniB-related protein n=1 Tax=Mycobacterium sp. OAE908 TaxID=2817899 RepID=UPI001AE648DB
MANSLLDFVMSLVRDPDAAAAYAADPGQAIADAHLSDVTSVDVNNLIPVVSESLSMAVPSAPSGGADTVIDDHASNVWASGAATAAFDAFDDHVPTVAVDDAHTVVDNLVTDPDAAVHSGIDMLADAGVPDLAGADDPSLHFDGPVIDDAPAIEAHAEDDWSHSAPEDHHVEPDHGGFDIFET